MLLFILWLIFIILILVILGTFAYGGILAAPWVPLWQKDVRRMLNLAEVKPDEMVYDLGAGDARIITIAAKEFGAKAIGFEIALLPYLFGRIRIWVKGLKNKVSLKYLNFFKQNLSEADVICVFLTPQAMTKLKPKLEKEIKPGCRVVSYAFSLPNWPPKKIDKPNPQTTTIYLYQK